MPADSEVSQAPHDNFFAAIEAGEIATVLRYLARDPALSNAISTRPLPNFPMFREQHPERVGSGLSDKSAKVHPPSNETALHVAVRHNQLAVARLLVTHGAEVNGVSRDRTPLQLALNQQAADVELIRFLVECGANVHGASSNIRVFGRKDWWPIVEYLLANGFNVNSPIQKNGRTLLDSVAMRLEHPWNLDFEPIIQTLLTYGAEVNLGGREDEDPPIVRTAALGCVGVARLLIAAGADPNLTSLRRHTALHAAARQGSFEMIELLLAAGADPSKVNSNGQSALQLTQPYLDTLELVERLLQK